MTNAANILPPANLEWGFFGTIERAGLDHRAWDAITIAIAEAIGDHEGYGAEAIRDFLDSRDGRHMADDFSEAYRGTRNLLAAADATVTKWQGWKTSRRDEREMGIPAGLPLLTGLVTHYGILAEMEPTDA